MSNKAILALAVVLLPVCTVNAKTDLKTPVNGYTRVVIDTEYEQQNPFSVVVNIEAPSVVVNNGQMLNFLLLKSGYQLADLKHTESETLFMYALPLPNTLRVIRMSTLDQALRVVIGKGFDYSVDHITRTVTIRPRGEHDVRSQ